MKETLARDFLQSLRRLSRQVSLYPENHPLTSEALSVMTSATVALLGDEGETSLAIAADSFYQNRVLLPHTSLEHNGLLREMQGRGIDSVTIRKPVSAGDLFDLAGFISGASDDLPADGTIRLNEEPVGDAALDQSVFADLRRSYAGGLDVLRSASYTVAAEGACDLASVTSAVEGFLAPSLENASATLLLSTVKSHDEYTFYHSLNTCILAISLGRTLGLSDVQLISIGAGAALHDIGKTAVPHSVLQHPGRLSSEQWREMKIHPQEGAQAIMAAGGPGHEFAATIALEHHMRFDGTGYPTAGHSHRPHLFSQLVSIVDVYDSITTRRPYRRAHTPSQALSIILEGSGTFFHPDLVRAYIAMVGMYPPGTLLQLASGAVVMVTDHDPQDYESLNGVIAKDPSGAVVDPEPISLHASQVAGHVLPEEVGVEPASLL